VLYPLLALIFKKLQRWKLGEHLSERLGFIPVNKHQNTVWVHAASVGELFSAQPIIEKLKAEGKTIYVTTSSLMGRTLCIERKLADYCALIPCDLLPAILMGYSRIKPQHVIIVENDLWPNFIMLAHLKNIKLTVVNGILRQRSLHWYKMFNWFFLALWKTVNHFFVQTEGDKERFLALGLPTNKITVSGTTKSVNVVKKYQDLQPLTVAPSNRSVLIFASMHENELTPIITALKACKAHDENMLALLVPRHKGWEKSLEKVLSENNFSWKTVNANSVDEVISERSHKTVDSIIVTEAGVLFKLHAYADVAYVGGTINTLGGHNITEPAVWGNAIIAGPHLENHLDILPELLKHGAILATSSNKEFEERLPALFANKELQKKDGLNAQKWVLADAALVKNGMDLIMKSVR
jgi:3-deoxy-D-manno-octulosonic-acid transferase